LPVSFLENLILLYKGRLGVMSNPKREGIDRRNGGVPLVEDLRNDMVMLKQEGEEEVKNNGQFGDLV